MSFFVLNLNVLAEEDFAPNGKSAILVDNLSGKVLYEKNADEKLKLGSKKAYTNLFFSGSNFYNFIESPQIGIHQKDQDFAIYRPISISIGNSKSINTNLPIVSI